MYCIYCGSKIDDNAQYCPNCGAKVAEDLGGPAGKTASKKAVPDVSAVFSKVKSAVPDMSAIKTDVSALKSGSSFSTMDLTALAAAVLSVVFALCSIKVYMTWLILIAAIGLAALCFARLRYDSMPMAVPVTLFAVAVVISSVRVFKYFKYYKALAVLQTILPFLFAICAVVIYWMIVTGKEEKRNLVVAEIVCLAGYAIICITSVLSGGAGSFRTAASRLTSVLFVFAYILRIIETSRVFVPLTSSAAFAEGTDFSSLPHYPHPYHKLGGYLKFTVIGGTIVCVLAIVAMIAAMVPIFKMLSYASKYVKVSFIYILLIVLIIISIVLYGLIIKLMMMIKNKNQRFLWYYHKLVIIETLVAFVLQWVSNGFGTALVMLIFYALLFFLYTLYFVKSVRVRTYMQSDEYLRIDPLTRNVPSPCPADLEPYTGDKEAV